MKSNIKKNQPSTTRGRTLTLSSGFFQSVCILESLCQSKSWFSSVRSNFQWSLARTVFNSIHARLKGHVSEKTILGLFVSCFVAYFLPKQPLAPKENGCVASNMSFSLWPSHLSGQNSSGDLKFADDKLAATGFVDTMVCRYRSMGGALRFQATVNLRWLANGAHQRYRLLREQLVGEEMEAAHKYAFPQDTRR